MYSEAQCTILFIAHRVHVTKVCNIVCIILHVLYVYLL